MPRTRRTLPPLPDGGVPPPGECDCGLLSHPPQPLPPKLPRKLLTLLLGPTNLLCDPKDLLSDPLSQPMLRNSEDRDSSSEQAAEKSESSKLRAAVMAVMTIMEEAAEAVIPRGEGGVKTVCLIKHGERSY